MSSQAEISRVNRTRAEARDSYDMMSGRYDLLTGLSEKKYKDMGLQKLKAREGERVLEIGFGTGECIKALAEAVGSTGKVCGIDLSEGMSQVTQAKIGKAGLSENVTLACGDGVQLPFGAGYFDALFMSFTLELFDTPEIPLALRECRRVLREDGRVCVVAMAKKEPRGLAVRIYEWAHEKFTKYVDCRPIYVQEALEEAGYQTESATEMSMFGLPVDVVVATQ